MSKWSIVVTTTVCAMYTIVVQVLQNSFCDLKCVDCKLHKLEKKIMWVSCGIGFQQRASDQVVKQQAM
jgi:low affinity Fe/Cu permease